MLRLINALFLSLTLALAGYGMAAARGQSQGINAQMVICTGVGITTISIDADGNPVESTHICPDAMSVFVAEFSTTEILATQKTLQWRAPLSHSIPAISAETLTPSARGPPLVV